MSKLPLFFLKIDTASAFCELTNDIPSISKSRIRNDPFLFAANFHKRFILGFFLLGSSINPLT